MDNQKIIIMSKVTYMTQEGFDKLKAEMEYLISVERPKISQQIAEAREKGDLSENAEYDAAKEAQALLELRISKIQEQIRNARVLDASQQDNGKVYLMSRVKIKNLTNNMVMEYTLVAENEANLKEQKLSVESPIAKGLLGKSKGDIAEVKVPSGLVKFEILEIGR
jgi:transcription elongation factor GreA